MTAIFVNDAYDVDSDYCCDDDDDCDGDHQSDDDDDSNARAAVFAHPWLNRR